MVELATSYGIDSSKSYEFAEGANQHLVSQRTVSSNSHRVNGKASSVSSSSDGGNGAKKDFSTKKLSKHQSQFFCEYCGGTGHLEDSCPHKGSNETDDSENDDEEEEDV
jgi:adenine-specific DNA methylase